MSDTSRSPPVCARLPSLTRVWAAGSTRRETLGNRLLDAEPSWAKRDTAADMVALAARLRLLLPTSARSSLYPSPAGITEPPLHRPSSREERFYKGSTACARAQRRASISTRLGFAGSTGSASDRVTERGGTASAGTSACD